VGRGLFFRKTSICALAVLLGELAFAAPPISPEVTNLLGSSGLNQRLLPAEKACTPSASSIVSIGDTPKPITAQDPKVSRPNEVLVVLPKDRCKPGWMYFGQIKCPVLGRGFTHPTDPGASVSAYNSKENTRYKKGTYPNGAACYYVAPNFKNGATPTGEYSVWKDGRRPGIERHGRIEYPFGKRPIACLDGIKTSAARSDLRVHSDDHSFPRNEFEREHTPAFYMRNAAGCLKLDGTDDKTSCQVLFNAWLDSEGASSADCSKDPKKVTLVIQEAGS
jgi:hypothetical protein